MADFTFKGYDNFILENKLESSLLTKMDMNRFMTMDSSLAEQPGMVKKIHTYFGSGDAEVLARGDSNTAYVDAEFIENEYRVERTQAQARYYDDDIMTDPVLIDKKVEQMSDAMVNIWTQKAIKEFGKTENLATFTDWKLGNWADAIAVYANTHETQEGLFCLCSMDLVPTIRRALGDSLQYVEAYIRTGAIGSVLGVPIYTSKALPKETMFLATSKAVTAFMKKGVGVEQDRNIDSKLNMLVASRYAVIALTDERECVMCGKAQSTPVTVTTFTKAQKTIAGAATTGATVTAYVNGKKTGLAVTAADSAYSITATDNLAVGDKVHVVAELNGFVKSIADVVVAE